MPSLFDGVIPFVHVARTRSFRRAAEELGVSTAAISKAVLRLEAELGVKLLHRTTRQVELSAEGGVFLARCEQAMAQIRTGRDLVARTKNTARGEVVVSLPFVLGRFFVAEVGRLTARHPGLRVQVRMSDRKLRLIEDRVDVAVRVGPLNDPSLVARKLTDTRWTIVASPAYLGIHGTPTTPAALAQHACLSYRSPRGHLVPWTVLQNGQPELVRVNGPLVVDQGELLVDAALAGLGIVQVFETMVARHVHEGRLVELLSDHAAPGPGVFALCLPEQRSTPRIRAVMDHLGVVFSERTR